MAKSGNFDLNFPGARIICDSIRKREAIIQYLNGDTSSIEVNLSHSNFEEDIKNAVFNTTYYHEGKHLYDHMVCPQLLHNYTLKLTAFFYSIRALKAWEDGNRPYKFIPLPFTSWIELSKEKKAELLKKKGLSTTDVPFFSLHNAACLLEGSFKCEDQFSEAILLAALHYSEFQFNNRHNRPDGYNTEFSVRTFTESMAFVQQMTDIALRYSDYGQSICEKILEDSFKHFMKLGELRRTENKEIEPQDYIGYSTYTAAFTMAWRYAIQNNIRPIYRYPFISYVLFWALSGNVLSSNKEASFPRNRLERLFNLDNMGVDLNLNQESNIQDLFNHPLKTFNRWDNLIIAAYAGTNIKILSLDNTFNLDVDNTPLDFEGTYTKFLRSFIAMTENLDSIGYNKPANYIREIANTIYVMNTLFVNNQSLYLYPGDFSNNRINFVNVPYRIEFNGVAPIKVDECPSLRSDSAITDNYVYGNNLFSDSQWKGPATLDWKTYHEASKYINFTDALLGNTDLNMPGHIVKEFLPGIKTWFFID